ncbi:MAG: N-acetyltransferase [Alphaproteobacteria bacterium]|nr:N-acetyltransferase [Alphaproteobacteria bacterium]
MDRPAPEIVIRPCEAADLDSVREIYAHHVLTGLASFEIEPPDAAEIRRRWQEVRSRGFPYLAAECDGAVIGYAYAGPYRTRPGYRFTAENSVYIRDGWAGRGIGRRLMQQVIALCEAQGLRQIVAVIGDSGNIASIRLHQSLGFATVGTLRSVGYKFDRWVDSVLMQRALRPGDGAPP